MKSGQTNHNRAVLPKSLPNKAGKKGIPRGGSTKQIGKQHRNIRPSSFNNPIAWVDKAEWKTASPQRNTLPSSITSCDPCDLTCAKHRTILPCGKTQKEQNNIVVLDEKNSSTVAGWFTRVFLPQGYPDSVSKDYAAYQMWDTAQAFCSTITGTLATQEVLRGVGVGDTAATPLAATFTWVLKDGCGHIGRILFAYSHGTSLDAYSKKWRLYADTLNDAAMLVEVSLPVFNNYTTVALCASTTMKAIVGVAGGATRAAMTQHHAVRGNMADVAAKDSAQETAVNLVASIFALMLISVFGSSLFIFLSVMIVHIICNYFAVRSVCLRTLNEPRLLQVIYSYLKHEVIPSPCVVNQNEPIVFYQIGPNVLDLKLCGFHIKSGHSLKDLTRSEDLRVEYLKAITEMYARRHYILFPSIGNRIMHVLIKEKADVDDVLCGYFHAVLLSTLICAINNEQLAVHKNSDKGTSRPFAEICALLADEDWARQDTRTVGYSGFGYEPTLALMQYVNRIAHKEWLRIRGALMQTGWDLSKHLIMCDEWRISSHTCTPPAIQEEKQTQTPEFLMSNTKFLPFDSALEEMKETDPDSDTFTIEPTSTASVLMLTTLSATTLRKKTVGSETHDNKDSTEPSKDRSTSVLKIFRNKSDDKDSNKVDDRLLHSKDKSS